MLAEFLFRGKIGGVRIETPGCFLRVFPGTGCRGLFSGAVRIIGIFDFGGRDDEFLGFQFGLGVRDEFVEVGDLSVDVFLVLLFVLLLSLGDHRVVVEGTVTVCRGVCEHCTFEPSDFFIVACQLVFACLLDDFLFLLKCGFDGCLKNELVGVGFDGRRSFAVGDRFLVDEFDAAGYQPLEFCDCRRAPLFGGCFGLDDPHELRNFFGFADQIDAVLVLDVSRGFRDFVEGALGAGRFVGSRLEIGEGSDHGTYGHRNHTKRRGFECKPE